MVSAAIHGYIQNVDLAWERHILTAFISVLIQNMI